MAGNFVERSRHGTVYYFRRRVPHDLRDVVGRRHIYVTLRTQERRTALLRARVLAVQTDRAFEEMRKLRRIVPMEFTVAISLAEESGRPKQIVFSDVKPEDEEAVSAIARKIASGGPAAPTGRETPTIREAIEDLIASGEVGPRSLKEYRRILGGFAAHFGEDARLGEIGQDRFAEYAAHIRAKADWSPKTKNTVITTAARLFNRYAGRNSAVPTITTKGLKLRRTRPAGRDRDAFTLDELRAIFANALRYRDREPCKWWITVAPVFLGCRIEELAQAHLAGDFYRDRATGAMVFHVTEDKADAAAPAKSVKTLAGWRRIPLHPILERAGFVQFLEAQREAGYPTPFAAQWAPFRDRTNGGTTHSHSAVKWGGRELRKLQADGKVGSDGGLTYFHSMRHTFVTLLAKAGVTEEWRAGLAGHAYGGVNATIYNKAREDVGETLPLIAKALAPVAALLEEVLGEQRAS